MSHCHARLVIAPRLVVGLAWWWNPLYPGTDLRRRMIRGRESVVGDRTNGASGRDEKDVGVHSCNCGVAEKSATRMATRIAVKTHASAGALFCMEWRATRLRWCKNGTIRHLKCPDWSFGPLISARTGIHKTKAGSCKLSKLAAQSFSGGF